MTSRRDFLKGAAGTIAAGPSAAKALAESLGTSLAGDGISLRSISHPTGVFGRPSWHGPMVAPTTAPPALQDMWRLKGTRDQHKRVRGDIDIDIAVMSSWSPAYKLLRQKMRYNEYAEIERPWYDGLKDAAKEMIVGTADSDVNTKR